MAKLEIVKPSEAEKQPAIEKRQVLLLAAPKNQPVPQVGAVKQKEFETFLLWCSIPAYFRRPPADRKTGKVPAVKEFCESLGVEDEIVLELAEIKTLGDFSARFGVHRDTLTNWKREIYARDMLEDLAIWAKPLMRNVMMAHYNACIRGGLPEHFKLFYQVVGKWSEKSQLDINKRVIKRVLVEVIKKHE